jgi:hypothetical protein
VSAHERRRRHDPRSLEEDEDVAGVERRAVAETRDQGAVERNRRHHLAEATRARHDVDGESRGSARRGAGTEAAGADDVERRLGGDNPPQHPAVTALERALEWTGARELLRARLRTIGPLRVERERRAQPRLLPEGHLA